MKNDMNEIGKNLLPIIAYGDSAGFPYETWSRKDILNYNGGEVDRLTSGLNRQSGIVGPGEWSDDTQLSLAVARSLMDIDGFNLQDIADKHIEEYNLSVKGWGGSTRMAVKNLIEGMDIYESGIAEGAGNGILMKMAPLVFWQHARKSSDAERLAQYDELTNLTHRNPVARLCTRVHGDVLCYLLDKGYNPIDFVDVVKEIAVLHEGLVGLGDEQLSNRLDFLKSARSLQDVLDNTDKRGFYVPETIAMTYGAFIVAQGEIKDSVFNGVNLGGDTDSFASIGGVMALFSQRGKVDMPHDLIGVEDIDMIKKVSEELAHRALGLFEVA